MRVTLYTQIVLRYHSDFGVTYDLPDPPFNFFGTERFKIFCRYMKV